MGIDGMKWGVKSNNKTLLRLKANTYKQLGLMFGTLADKMYETAAKCLNRAIPIMQDLVDYTRESMK